MFEFISESRSHAFVPHRFHDMVECYGRGRCSNQEGLALRIVKISRGFCALALKYVRVSEDTHGFSKTIYGTALEIDPLSRTSRGLTISHHTARLKPVGCVESRCVLSNVRLVS